MVYEEEEETTVSAQLASGVVRPCLEVIESREPALVGRIFPIGEGMSIGRRDCADLRLLDRSVSRDHARLRVAGDDYTLSHLGTTNGTFVNGVRIEQVLLQVGDLVRVGLHTVMRFARDNTRWSLRLTDALVAARIALWEWDSVSGSIFTSRNFSQVTGLPGDLPDEPAPLLELVHPDDRARAAAAVRAAFADSRAIELELRLRPRMDGGEVWLAIKGNAGRSSDGISLSGSVANTSVRKRAERELRRLTQVLENMYDAIVVLDLDGRITDWTSKADATFRLARERAVGTALADLIGADNMAALQRETAEHGHYTAEIASQCGGGPPAVYEVACGPLKDEDGVII